MDVRNKTDFPVLKKIYRIKFLGTFKELKEKKMFSLSRFYDVRTQLMPITNKINKSMVKNR